MVNGSPIRRCRVLERMQDEYVQAKGILEVSPQRNRLA